MKHFLEILALAIVVMAVIASCSCAFNSKEGFYIVCGIITLASNGFFAYKIGKSIERKY